MFKHRSKQSKGRWPLKKTKIQSLPLISGEFKKIKTISYEILFKAITKLYDSMDKVDHFKIVDCRTPTEFDGGHIQEAVNLHDSQTVEDLWKIVLQRVILRQRVVLVFYCDFSSFRAPLMMEEFVIRRKKRLHQYKHFLELYLLSGGYVGFYDQEHCRTFCEPKNYVPMWQVQEIQQGAKTAKVPKMLHLLQSSKQKLPNTEMVDLLTLKCLLENPSQFAVDKVVLALCNDETSVQEDAEKDSKNKIPEELVVFKQPVVQFSCDDDIAAHWKQVQTLLLHNCTYVYIFYSETSLHQSLLRLQYFRDLIDREGSKKCLQLYLLRDDSSELCQQNSQQTMVQDSRLEDNISDSLQTTDSPRQENKKHGILPANIPNDVKVEIGPCETILDETVYEVLADESFDETVPTVTSVAAVTALNSESFRFSPADQLADCRTESSDDKKHPPRLSVLAMRLVGPLNRIVKNTENEISPNEIHNCCEISPEPLQEILSHNLSKMTALNINSFTSSMGEILATKEDNDSIKNLNQAENLSNKAYHSKMPACRFPQQMPSDTDVLVDSDAKGSNSDKQTISSTASTAEKVPKFESLKQSSSVRYSKTSQSSKTRNKVSEVVKSSLKRETGHFEYAGDNVTRSSKAVDIIRRFWKKRGTPEE